MPPTPLVCAVKTAAASVLEHGADVLDASSPSPDSLASELAELGVALDRLERGASLKLPAVTAPNGAGSVAVADPVGTFVTALDPSFRAQELSFVVSQMATNIELAAAAERRSWLERLLGRQPAGLAGPLSAAQERAAAHVQRHSVWLHNSVRGAAGLSLAVLVAQLTGVQHGFWVVFGTLSVLRSNALSTGENVVRGLLGTTIGLVVGAALVSIIDPDTTALWLLLPVAVLFAGLAPATISFAAGQAGFTVILFLLFNILQPVGWRVGIVRLEDVLLGSAVSLVVGLLFWPRGAAAAFGEALGEAYDDSVRYLAGAVEFGLARCDAGSPNRVAPTDAAMRAAAAARRLDDTFRSYLAERGAKPVPLAEVTGLVNGVVALRLAADAVLDLWERDEAAPGDRAAARRELLQSSDTIVGWYDRFARSLTGEREVPEPLRRDELADGRLLDAVARDLRGDDGQATSTAVRMIWTGDHLDAARRLQDALVGPARTANAQHALVPSPVAHLRLPLPAR